MVEIKRAIIPLILLMGVGYLLFYALPAKADIAPPRLPPGANPQPGKVEVPTLVRMAAEDVLIVVEKTTTPIEEVEGITGSEMRARVEAQFTMHNDGRDDEAFEVWFPLGDHDGYTHIVILEDFQVWVDGREIKIEQKYLPGFFPQEMAPWAIWWTKFPAGEDLNIRVSYFMRPTGYPPFGTFSYILETGAGWHGKIGRGKVTFRLPYPVDKFNTMLNQDTDDPLQPGGYRISGPDILWQFEDLEPSAADNIRVTVLTPHIWEGIEQARYEVEQRPSSGMAALELAEALAAALQFKYGLVGIGDSETLLQDADEAYRRAIELEPFNGRIYKAYARFLEKQSQYGIVNKRDPALEKLLPILGRAIELNPADTELEEMRQNIAAVGITIPTADPMPSVESVNTRETSMPVSVDTALPPPSPLNEDLTQITAIPTSIPQESSMQNFACPAGSAAVLFPLGVWLLIRKRTY